MKQLLKNFNYFLFLVFIALVACNKQKPEIPSPFPTAAHSIPNPIPSPPSSPHRIKARVVEYGSDLPIAGARVELVVPLPFDYISELTNENGDIWFTANDFVLKKFSDPKYWDLIITHQPFSNYLPISPVEVFPSNGEFDYYSGYISSCDSVVLKMFPITFITIHLKDSLLLPLLNPDDKMILSINGSFTSSGKEYFIYGGPRSDLDGAIIKLRPGIDTVFKYPVFGNTYNSFNVGEDDATEGWILNYIHRETRYIAKGRDIQLNITF